MSDSYATKSTEAEKDAEKLKILYEERIQSIKDQVQLFFTELENDAVYKAVKENKYSREFSIQRASELFEFLMKSEQEITINKLQNALAATCAKVKRLENQLQDLRMLPRESDFKEDSPLFANRKEMENSFNRKSELLVSEIEYLKAELKIRENSYMAESQELKIFYEDQIKEVEKNYELISSQFNSYQRQSEELSLDQQKVIKSLLEKTRKMKQKILSQRSKLDDQSRVHKELIDKYEKNLEEAEEKMQLYQRENTERECEIFNKHRAQMAQLQIHYQELMNIKLAEMQKEVDEQVLRSQEYEHELRNLMEVKLREIEKSYWHKDLCQKKIEDKEQEVTSFYLKANKEECERIQEEFDEALRKIEGELGNEKESKEKLQKDLKDAVDRCEEVQKDLKSSEDMLGIVRKECESQLKELRKAEKDKKSLNDCLGQMKMSLAENLEKIESQKAEFNLMLMQKVEKAEYDNLQLKLSSISKDHEIKLNYIKSLESELKSLSDTLQEISLHNSNNSQHLEHEKLHHQETKAQLVDLQNYSQHLLNELDYYEKESKSLNSTLSDQTQELTMLHQALDNKEKDLQSFRQLALNKDSDFHFKFRAKQEFLIKFFKSSIFQLKSLQHDLCESYQREVNHFKKQFSSFSQDLSLNILAGLVSHKKIFENRAEGLSCSYYNKLQVLEENIRRGELYWTDSDTDGIRRAVKGLVEDKQMAVIENRSLKETLAKLKEDNRSLYGETQDLQKKLHFTYRPSSDFNASGKNNSGILRSRLGNSYKDIFNN